MMSLSLLKSIGGISAIGFVTKKILDKLDKKDNGNLIIVITAITIVSTILESIVDTCN
jgi:hypothetical protein